MTTAIMLNSAVTVDGNPIRISAVDARPNTQNKCFQAIVKGSGAVSATLSVDVSNNGFDWIKDVATLSVSGTDMATEGFASDEPWAYYRGRLTAISGTGAMASLIMGL
ncbi:hypothetical protein VPH49_21930 [Pseudomonas luteola]|uniref:hypothetical protein n=1 Tax=Pseudomonas luteola TaxID=47886 RepID=UPI003A87168D